MSRLEEIGRKYYGGSLEPGIYIGSRKVPAPGNFRHQFMVLVPENPEKFKGKIRDLGNGVKGIVVGGYVQQGTLTNILGRGKLTYHRNHDKDLKIIKRHLKGDPEDDSVLFRAGKGQKFQLDDKIDEIMKRGRSFRYSTRDNPVPYPNFIKNLLGWGKNSNSFIQTLAAQAGIKNREIDPPGVDPGTGLRLPRHMFQLKEGSAAYIGYLEGYLSKVAKKKDPLPKAIGKKVQKEKDRAVKIMGQDPQVPLDVLGEPEIISKVTPASRAALIALLAAIPGSLAGAGIAELGMPDEKNAPLIGAGVGAASLGIPAGLLTYLNQRARQRADSRAKEHWLREIDKEYQ